MYKTIIAVIISLYFLGCAVMFGVQRELLYFPQPKISMDNIAYDSVTLKTEVGDLHGYLLNPGKTASIFFFGGNASRIEERAELMLQYLPNYSIYLLPYRGFSANPGSPSEDALYQDALAWFDQESSKYQQNNIIGRSLGSGVATKVASERDIHKLMLITPFDSVTAVAADRYWMVPVNLLILDKFDSYSRADALDMEIMVLKSSEDHTVPHQYTDHLVSALDVQQTRVITIENSTHSSIVHKDEYGEALQSFFY